MNYLKRSFTVKMGLNQAYRDNFDKVFSRSSPHAVDAADKKESDKTASIALPDPLSPRVMAAPVVFVTVQLSGDLLEAIRMESNDANSHTAAFKTLVSAVRAADS